jgi:hypothetical protein
MQLAIWKAFGEFEVAHKKGPAIACRTFNKAEGCITAFKTKKLDAAGRFRKAGHFTGSFARA